MKFDIMTILSLLITLAVCGFFYYRMIIREIPKPISLINALVPICGGMATFEISGLTGIMLYMINEPVRTALAKLPAVLESLLSAFLSAGMPEEIFKGIVLIIMIVIFKPKKVYEYILMGAAVGFGFTIMEEKSFIDASDAVFVIALRCISLPSHMALNMVMGEFFGRAKYNKLKGQGPQTLNYILAFLVPALIHTAYDAFAANNMFLWRAIANDKADAGLWIGLGLFAFVYIAFPAFTYYWLYRCKKKTADFCAMETL